MAKNDRDDLLERWRKAEAKYRAAADPLLDVDVSPDKSVVVAVTNARVKADKRMQEYFSAVLG